MVGSVVALPVPKEEEDGCSWRATGINPAALGWLERVEREFCLKKLVKNIL
jgi:hypothetical protein